MQPTNGRPQAIILLSGGLDSTTALAMLAERGYDITAMIFDYGQRLAREVDLAHANAIRYGARPLVLNEPLGWLDPACSILGDTPVTKGRTLAEIDAGGAPTSYVPFRNGIFFAYAVAYGEPRGIELIVGGCNGRSGHYPDDTEEFGRAFEVVANIGTQPSYTPRLWLPYATKTKAQIVGHGRTLGVDYTQTWSCYENGTIHCGQCDSCVQRAAAFAPNNLDLEGRPLR